MTRRYGKDDTGYMSVTRDSHDERTYIVLDDSVMDALTDFMFKHGDPDGPLMQLADSLAIAQDEMHERY